jgi:hypothetical protein
MRSVLGLALPLLLAATAAAQDAAAPPQAQCLKPQSSEAVQSGSAPEVLFYRYAAESPEPGVHHFTVRAFAGKRLVLTEEILAHADAGTVPVVEILSRNPDALKDLRRQSREGGDVQLEVVHPDGTVARATLAELEAKSGTLVQEPGLPQRVVSKVKAASAEPTASLSSACDQCYADYDHCVGGCHDSPNCIYRCERQLGRCLDICAHECQPYSQEVTEGPVVVAQHPLYSDCIQTIFDTEGHYYTLFERVLRQTRKRITYYCDGSQTVEILEVTYSTSNCWGNREFYSCLNPDYVGWVCVIS